VDWFEEEIDSVFNIQIPAAEGIPFERLDFDFVDNGLTNESYAAFGQTDIVFNDRLSATIGLRHTRDEKTKPDSFQEIRRVNSVGPPPLQILPQNIEGSWSRTTWRAGLNYTPTDDTLIYGTFSTGYKAGGFNRGVIVDRYAPETIDAWEVGIKHDFWGGRGRANLAAFYYDYNDLQQSQTEIQPDGGLENVTRNAAEATIHGLELELTLVPWERGLLAASFGYLDAEFDEFTDVPDDIVGGVEDLSGNRLINAPEWTANLTLEPWRFDLARGSITPRVQFRYESSAFLRVQNKDFDKRDAFTKTDISVNWESDDGRWYASAFVNNLENRNVITAQSGGTVIIGVGPSHKGNFAAPRTQGIRVGMNF